MMQPRAEYGHWVRVTGPDGTVALLPGDFFATLPPEQPALVEFLGWPPGSMEVEVITGWCSQYSADGFLDCSDWQGPYDTEGEALEELKRDHNDEEECDACDA